MKDLVKKIMSLISWLRNRKDYKDGKRINLSNILNYAEAELNHWKSTSSFASLPKWKEEISIWRLSQVKEKSPNCLINGNCIRCGCDTVAETFGSLGCKYGCYPDRPTEFEWEKFKKENKIEQIC